MSKDSINPKNKRKEIIIISIIGLAFAGSFALAISGKSSPTKSVGTTTSQPSSSSSSSNPPQPSSSLSSSNPPIPQSTTAAEMATEPINVPSTPTEKAYYACLQNPSTMGSSACQSASKFIGTESNVFGSNLAAKFKYQISEDLISSVRNALIGGLSQNKIMVNGVDYYSKMGVHELPQDAMLLNPQSNKSISLKGVTAFIYSSPQTKINFCLSVTSFDGEVTWRSNLTVPNLTLGAPCSLTSLK